MACDKAVRHRDLVYALESARGTGALNQCQLTAFEAWLERDLLAMTDEEHAQAAILDPFPSHTGLIDLPVVEGASLPVRLLVV